MQTTGNAQQEEHLPVLLLSLHTMLGTVAILAQGKTPGRSALRWLFCGSIPPAAGSLAAAPGLSIQIDVGQLYHCRGHNLPFSPSVQPLQLESSFVCSVASLNLFPDP